MRCRDSHAGIFKLAQVSFQLMEKILQNENMTFADVVRQWNYIENILDRTQGQSELSQNYQDFNEARAAFYKKADFVNGYPAATGIGMNTGGIIIDFIAIPGGNDVKIVPIKNPRQVDAHRYSREVLIGDPMTGPGQKAPPKFERAKFVSLHGTPEIYISGTAAILGQETAGQDVEEQTRITIENIRLLISDENLKNCGIELEPAQKTITYIRVYVKEEKDIPAVKRVCEDYYKDVPALYLVSDICRDRLSVEIEGIAKSKNSS
jgi:enamine deaminase RidA (YjgF/YER057c/UK114 family)